jgi:putative hydrolase of the HAD superfamily
MLDLIAFDADDTLWHNEVLYEDTQREFQALLAGYDGDGRVRRLLFETEMQNLQTYGYGTKAFALSMIETAIQVSQGQVGGREIAKILDLAKTMLSAPVRLLDHVPETVAGLAASYPLMLITKGDLLDQERKILESGMAGHFTYIEVVSDKNEQVYRSLLERHRLAPDRFLMVGNSLRSDVLPVVALGGHAVHIPYHTTWAHERVDDTVPGTFVELEHMGLLPGHVEWLSRSAQESGM